MDHSPEEKALADKVLAALPGAKVMVEDVSGGCGSSYNVHVESDVFAGMTRIKQHRLVSGPLKEDMKTIHALRIFTETPKE